MSETNKLGVDCIEEYPQCYGAYTGLVGLKHNFVDEGVKILMIIVHSATFRLVENSVINIKLYSHRVSIQFPRQQKVSTAKRCIFDASNSTKSSVL